MLFLRQLIGFCFSQPTLCRRECDDLCIKYCIQIYKSNNTLRHCYDLMIPYEAISRNVLLVSVTSIPRTKQTKSKRIRKVNAHDNVNHIRNDEKNRIEDRSESTALCQSCDHTQMSIDLISASVFFWLLFLFIIQYIRF